LGKKKKRILNQIVEDISLLMKMPVVLLAGNYLEQGIKINTSPSSVSNLGNSV